MNASNSKAAKWSRRQVLVASASLSAVAAGSLLFSSESKARTGTLLSAYEDARGDQYVGGVSLQDQKVFGARVSMRAHGCAVHPTDPNRVLFFARRPGTQAFELDRVTMQARSVFTTEPGRHLAGHGTYSADGSLILTPEHDFERARGVVVVRDARNFAVVGEIDTSGIDPHEVAWLPDHRSLLVANGGIMTHPRSFRRKLNIPTMDPSLCVIDAATGQRKEQWRLPDHLLSIRHVSMTSTGITAVGLQYEGEDKNNAPGIVALYRPGQSKRQAQFRLLSAPASEIPKFQGYVASVAISETHDLIAAACPYGNGVACWSISDERYLGFVAASETYGLSRVADGSIVASQRDGTAYDLDETRLRSQFLKIASSQPIRWDDHWVATV
ncbi:DUF1513 domain-containing protein [Peristeroidobacter agariperforans]|uniref:DUF1513 domain-containing protein n=1 Tax=Peristeroidobacter agariperforans TaxID=268404 RepID=UPI00101E0833|nr:DUF1513 domain-containing protein [Peristeroidobacter agariperforans]